MSCSLINGIEAVTPIELSLFTFVVILANAKAKVSLKAHLTHWSLGRKNEPCAKAIKQRYIKISDLVLK